LNEGRLEERERLAFALIALEAMRLALGTVNHQQLPGRSPDVRCQRPLQAREWGHFGAKVSCRVARRPRAYDLAEQLFGRQRGDRPISYDLNMGIGYDVKSAHNTEAPPTASGNHARATTRSNFSDVSAATAPISYDLNSGIGYDVKSAHNSYRSPP
jgi:hypothetical protein